MPVYPYCKSGFEPINENFFYYKSAAFKLTGPVRRIPLHSPEKRARRTRSLSL